MGAWLLGVDTERVLGYRPRLIEFNRSVTRGRP